MKKLFKLLVFVAIVYLFFYVNNNWLVTTELVHESEKIPASFDGYRITQVTDLHDANFGENQSRLVEKLRATNQHITVIPSYRGEGVALDMLQELHSLGYKDIQANEVTESFVQKCIPILKEAD